MRALFAPVCLATAIAAQSPIACFDFEGDSISSTQPSFAAVSDLSISNSFMFGGPASDSWLCLTTQWNNTGGTITFTVTPNVGESLQYSSLTWSSVTNTPSLSDSVSAVEVFANGVSVGSIDPLLHDTLNTIDLSGYDALQGSPIPVTFVLDFTGNPQGQSNYEVADMKLNGERCVLAIDSVTPSDLPVVTSECFTLLGDCLDQVTGVKWNGSSLPVCAPANFGQGCYEIVDAHTLKVCPPLCEPIDTYTIEIERGSETASHDVGIFQQSDARTVCPATHPAGTELCVTVSTGDLPQPNAVFVILSPTNVPSIIPGIIEMQLGNMLQDYFCGPAHISECFTECYAIPPALVGTTWYFQSIVWNPFQTTFPLPVTNLCGTTFY